MKPTIRKIAMALCVACMAGHAAPAAAVDINMHAAITTHKAISVAVKSEMNFGDVTFEETNSGTINLATNGSVNLSGASGLQLGGTASAGKVSISGDTASDIEISCENSGTLSNGQSSALILKNIEIAMNTGTGPGMGAACNGLGNTSLTHSLGSANDLLIGGALDISQSKIVAEGHHTTASAGGDPITIRMVYQ